MKTQIVKWLRQNFFCTVNINKPYSDEGYLSVKVYVPNFSFKTRLHMCWDVLTDERIVGVVKDSSLAELKFKNKIEEHKESIRILENKIERIHKESERKDYLKGGAE